MARKPMGSCVIVDLSGAAGTRGQAMKVVFIIAICVGDSKSRAGWAAGAGIEYAVWENLSLKLEYLHADFGTTEYINPAVRIGNSNFTTRDVRLTDDIVRAGLNWRFNWAGPVVARY